MNENWKPGDVAMVTFGFGEKRRAMRDAGGTGWGIVGEVDSLQVQDARRLPVPDPESAEDMERLAEIYASATHGELNDYPLSIPALHMQAALREFANPTPPKPDEPTGLGAVVEAIYDNQFVRTNDGPTPWVRTDRRHLGATTWDDIDVVRILSPGVTP